MEPFLKKWDFLHNSYSIKHMCHMGHHTEKRKTKRVVKKHPFSLCYSRKNGEMAPVPTI